MMKAVLGQGQDSNGFADLEWQDFLWSSGIMKRTVEDWKELVNTCTIMKGQKMKRPP